MNKTSKEYAEKLASEYKFIPARHQSICEKPFTDGYMTAIKENNVPELIEALEEAKLQLEYLDEKFKATGTTSFALAKVNNALKKSKETNTETYGSK